MKKTFRAIVIAIAAVTALIACSKEADPVEAGKMEKGKIGVSVSALMAELTPAEGETKASVASVVRLTWENADIVSAFCGSEYLGHLTVSVSDDNKMVAKLTGEITAPTSGTTITLIHSNIEPTVSGSTVSVDLSDQKTTKDPFVVYGTLKYTGTAITDQTVPFKFATSLMFVTVTGLDDTDVDIVMVSGINTVCQLTVQSNGEPTVAGTAKGTITTDKIAVRSDERAIFNIGIAKDNNTGRKISAVQGETTFEADFTATELAESASYVSVYALKEVIDYVVMKMGSDQLKELKWATKNLGAKTVAGSYTTCYGDLYEWGSVETIYKERPWTGPTTWDFTDKLKDGKTAGYAWQTYCGNSNFVEWVPTPYDATTKILIPEKDVAKVKLGNGWRMPTKDDFQDLYDACVGEEGYDNSTNPTTGKPANKGVYWCDSYDGVAGVLFYDGTNKLFFPAAGSGINNTELEGAGTFCCYWSSSLLPDDSRYAYSMFFASDDYCLQANGGSRYCGYSIRPVSE